MLGAAIQNKVYIITANRIGKEREYKFTGRSQIVDPMMKILAKSKENIEEVKVVEIDIKKLEIKN
jgi:predicted amidohydrolase